MRVVHDYWLTTRKRIYDEDIMKNPYTIAI